MEGLDLGFRRNLKTNIEQPRFQSQLQFDYRGSITQKTSNSLPSFDRKGLCTARENDRDGQRDSSHPAIVMPAMIAVAVITLVIQQAAAAAAGGGGGVVVVVVVVRTVWFFDGTLFWHILACVV